jgi:chaperonin cofactor prefoldin
MESKKVKEIKKALECCGKNNPDCDNCPYSVSGGSLCRQPEQDALTLINELESENDTLHTNLCEYRKENQQLKDRISELEKENAKLLDSVETVQSNRCVFKCELTKKHLTQFAKRLREKLDEKKHFLVAVTSVCKHLDETLKEYRYEKD